VEHSTLQATSVNSSNQLTLAYKVQISTNDEVHVNYPYSLGANMIGYKFKQSTLFSGFDASP